VITVHCALRFTCCERKAQGRHTIPAPCALSTRGLRESKKYGLAVDNTDVDDGVKGM
jgi:hypothetical protein